MWQASVDRFLNSLKSERKKLAYMQRSAKEQLEQTVQRQSFSIDLHLDAPKVAIPVGVNANGGRETQLLLDLGHFTLKTDQVLPPHWLHLRLV